MSEIKSISGKVIKINEASFEDCCQLQELIASILAETGLDLNNIDFNNLNEFVKNTDIDFILKPILKMISNKEFRQIIFKCLNRSLYDNERITPELFDIVENRGDYYPIVIECLKVNILPFFSKLLSR
jgi:hypothetical protein